MMHRFLIPLTLFLAITLSGCFHKSKEDILSEAEDVRDIGELITILGEPDLKHKMNGQEEWSYKANNGKVVFVVAGNSVVEAPAE